MKSPYLRTTTSHLTFLIIFSLSFFACSSNDATESAEEQLSLTSAENMLTFVNEARLDAGLNTLTLNDALNTAAYKHSLDMETNDYFNHIGLNNSSFSERAINAGYAGSPIGENIARGQSSTEAAFTSWMNSEGHRNNILNSNATEMGLGLSGAYWTQVFGKGN